MKIFISYAHVDTSSVLDMIPALNAHEVWFDNRLNIGQDWWREIEQQIAGCHCFMLVVSPESMKSEYCQKELDYALKMNKPVAPVMIKMMDIPDKLRHLQIIKLLSGVNSESIVQLLNGLFEIERIVFNPLKRLKPHADNTEQLSITDLYFATTNIHKQRIYEQIIGAKFQISHLDIEDIQHVDVSEVALYKAKRAFEILKKPVFVENSAIAIRAWGGLPGGLSTSMLPPLGLNNLCRMIQPFEDKHAEAVTAIGFTDGQVLRKFIGVLPGTIADTPRGNGYSWNNIFIPQGFTKTLGEMAEEEYVSLSSRRRAIIEFMQFLQSNYEVV